MEPCYLLHVSIVIRFGKLTVYQLFQHFVRPIRRCPNRSGSSTFSLAVRFDLRFIMATSMWSLAIATLLLQAATLSTATPGQSVAYSTIFGRADDIQPEYDYVIVGGGTAGLTVADRLTENRRCKYDNRKMGHLLTVSDSVLVIEFGEFRKFKGKFVARPPKCARKVAANAGNQKIRVRLLPLPLGFSVSSTRHSTSISHLFLNRVSMAARST